MYRLIRFGSQSLEHYNQIDDIGSGETPTSYSPLPEGGALDNFGGQRKHPGVVERIVSRRLQMSSESALSALYFSLLSLRGQRRRLFRQLITGEVQWMYARLVSVSAQRDYQLTPYKCIQDIELRFTTQEAFWHGNINGPWYFDDGHYFDDGLFFDSGEAHALTASPTSFTISVGLSTDAGRAPSRALKITLSAGSSPMSAITIARTSGETLVFSGTIAATQQLVIDTGAMQVLNNGVDAYASLTFTPTADMAAWFTLQPGDNVITVSYTGGGTGKQIEITCYEEWY
jgi:hypothetical protein